MLLYPGALAGSVGQHFESMVETGGPLGELVQWADLSACLTILGHKLTFSTSQQQLQRLEPLCDTTSYLHLACNVIDYMLNVNKSILVVYWIELDLNIITDI